MSQEQRCKHVGNGGKRCAVTFGLSEDGWCWHHDPAKKSERKRAQSRGGRTTAEKRRKRAKTVDAAESMSPPETAEEAKEWASWATWAVATGKLDWKTAKQVQYGVRTFLAALEKSVLEEAIQDLKAQVAELRGERPKLEVTGG